jgi:hypothetical protein
MDRWFAECKVLRRKDFGAVISPVLSKRSLCHQETRRTVAGVSRFGCNESMKRTVHKPGDQVACLIRWSVAGHAVSLKWAARTRRTASGSLIAARCIPCRKSIYSWAIAGAATSTISRFSSQNSMTWKTAPHRVRRDQRSSLAIPHARQVARPARPPAAPTAGNGTAKCAAVAGSCRTPPDRR